MDEPMGVLEAAHRYNDHDERGRRRLIRAVAPSRRRAAAPGRRAAAPQHG
jgi:hypothetical protein